MAAVVGGALALGGAVGGGSVGGFGPASVQADTSEPMHRSDLHPLMAGQDPSVVWRDGYFYLVQSENWKKGAGLFVYKSPTLEGISSGEKVCIWRAPARGPMSRNVWAPEIVWVDGFGGDGAGRWYIYFAADDGRNENHRMFALESTGADPTGPYVLKGKVADPLADRWAIDGTVIDTGQGLNRKLYFVWSGWEGAHNGMQHIYVAPMSDPWTISGRRMKISSPELDWERRSGAHPCYVNEGPAVVVRNGKVIVGYSANGFWSDDYCMGTLSCDAGRVMEPGAWKKESRGPSFARTDEIFGVGHHSFFEVAGGAAEAGWWMVYHGVRQPGRSGKGREIFVKRIGWSEEGLPVLGRAGETPMLASLPK
jgi:GH43 family beta-xylosidase